MEAKTEARISADPCQLDADSQRWSLRKRAKPERFDAMQQSAKHAKRLEPSAEANALGVSSRAAAEQVRCPGSACLV